MPLRRYRDSCRYVAAGGNAHLPVARNLRGMDSRLPGNDGQMWHAAGAAMSWQPSATIDALRLRARLNRLVRDFFRARDVLDPGSLVLHSPRFPHERLGALAQGNSEGHSLLPRPPHIDVLEQQRAGRAGPESIPRGRFGERDCVTFTFLAMTPAVEDDQHDWTAVRHAAEIQR